MILNESFLMDLGCYKSVLYRNPDYNIQLYTSSCVWKL